MSEYAGRQFVGIDLHRRRSVVVRTTESGEALEATRILCSCSVTHESCE
jgi:hypothetical protein